MSMKYKTLYLERGGTKLAYQVFGPHSQDLIFVPGILSHIEYIHEMPGYSEFIDQLSKYFRVIIFDKRGNGLSKRSLKAPTLEERMDDIRFVMDEVSSKKAILFGYSEGALISTLFASMNPDRVEKIILFGGLAVAPGREKKSWIPKFIKKVLKLREINSWVKNWGDGRFMELTLPSKKLIDSQFKEKLAKFESLSNTPEGIKNLIFMNGRMDVRPFLKNVCCPALILHSRNDNLIPFESSLPFVEKIKNSKLVELEKAGHSFYLNESELILDHIISFSRESHLEKLHTVLAAVMSIETNDLIKIKKQVEFFEGTLFKVAENQVIVIFNGPSRAIQCALKIKKVPHFRVGLHIGEVKKGDREITGQGVDTVLKVQEMASLNQILVTDLLRSLVYGLEIKFEEAPIQNLNEDIRKLYSVLEPNSKA